MLHRAAELVDSQVVLLRQHRKALVDFVLRNRELKAVRLLHFQLLLDQIVQNLPQKFLLDFLRRGQTCRRDDHPQAVVKVRYTDRILVDDGGNAFGARARRCHRQHQRKSEDKEDNPHGGCSLCC